MRYDSSYSLDGLKTLIEDFFQKTESSRTLEGYLAQKFRLGNPTSKQLEDVEILKELKFKQFIVLTSIVHFGDKENLGNWYLRFALERYLEKTLNTKKTWYLLLLEQKEYFLKYLHECSDFTLSSYFSLLTSKQYAKKLEFRLKLKYPERSKPIQAERKRGYRDHGTLPDRSSSARRKAVMEEQNLREEVFDYQREVELLKIVERKLLILHLEGGVGFSTSVSYRRYLIREEKEVLQEMTVNERVLLEAKIEASKDKVHSLDEKIRRLEEERERLLKSISRRKKVLKEYEARVPIDRKD